MPLLNLFFSWVGLALGCVVRRFHKFFFLMFSKATDFGKSHSLIVNLPRVAIYAL